MGSALKTALIAGALLYAVGAAAQERQITYDFVGFSKDGEHFVVKKYDHDVGWSFSIRTLHDGVQVKRIPFDESSEDRTFKRMKRKYDLREGEGPKSPDGKFVIMGAQDGKYLDVLVMQKPRIGRFKDIPLKVDKETKAVAEGSLKKAMWSPDGKWVVVVMTERTKLYERDKVFSWKFHKWSVKWFYEEKKE